MRIIHTKGLVSFTEKLGLKITYKLNKITLFQVLLAHSTFKQALYKSQYFSKHMFYKLFFIRVFLEQKQEASNTRVCGFR